MNHQGIQGTLWFLTSWVTSCVSEHQNNRIWIVLFMLIWFERRWYETVKKKVAVVGPDSENILVFVTVIRTFPSHQLCVKTLQEGEWSVWKLYCHCSEYFTFCVLLKLLTLKSDRSSLSNLQSNRTHCILSFCECLHIMEITAQTDSGCRNLVCRS